MLRSLRIENFALIDRLELDLAAGLTVLTGETGAGKSIILDAIDVVLGGKVSGRVVRAGAEKAVIEATFCLDADLMDWLTAQAIAPTHDNCLVCSREIRAGQSSRSRPRVNGVVVDKQLFEQLRDRLVEITAQGQTVQLGQPALQREWLDSYGGAPLLHQRAQVAAAFTAYQQATQNLEKRRRFEQERQQQLDLFEFQLRELEAAQLSDPDELDRLEQERKRLTHSVELQQKSYQVYQRLYDNDQEGGTAAADLLGEAEHLLQAMAEYDAQIQPFLELVSNALTQVQEAGRGINLYGENIEADPQRLQEVEERMVELKQICRKYGPRLLDAIALYQQRQQEIAELTGGGQSLQDLEQTQQLRQQQLIADCGKLTQLRQTAAHQLEQRLVDELRPLAMEKVQFQVQVQPIPPLATGADQITFLFSPNPGEPLQPLSEIASGGEMSRFLLALQSSFSQVDPVGTLVFDEIDVGVSGRVTQAIAEKLYHLSRHHQVLCVTHQAIVAATADTHLHVSKHTVDGLPPNNQPNGVKGKTHKVFMPADNTLKEEPDAVRTVVRVVPLTEIQRREELAQLAGGKTDPEAIAFAESLLKQAATLRQALSLAATSPEPATLKATATSQAKSTKSRASRKNSSP